MRKKEDEMVARFLYDMKLEGKATSTIKVYANRIKQFTNYLRSHDLLFENVKHVDILDFIRYLQKKSQKNSTLKNELTTIYVLYKWGQKQGIVSQSPLDPDDYPTVKNERIKRLTNADMRTFIAYIDSLQENLRAAFWLLIGTGARVGEAANLTASDVYLRGRSVYIDIKNAKWGSDRCIPITEKRAAEIVWKFRQTVPVDNRPLFRVSKRTLQWYATKFSKETGIPFKCHLLRHTYAALMTERGVPITTTQYLLGHRSVAMTAYYAQSALVDVSDITPQI